MATHSKTKKELLDEDLTVFETVDKIATGEVRTKLRDILAAFLFRGEDVDKKTVVLSGGERSRLAMAVLMLQPYNVLLLDEPTNHMDIQSKEILKEALLNYTGTLVLVSHDRTFLDGLVNKVYEFRDGKVKEHLGGIGVFLERRRAESPDEVIRTPEAQSSASTQYQQRKERERTLRKLESAVTRLENSIEAYEEKLSQMDAQLQSPPAEGFEPDFYRTYEKEKKGLDLAMKAWETAHNKRDAFIKEMEHE
jgi:ATP-binding cassette subfamily F protein 3